MAPRVKLNLLPTCVSEVRLSSLAKAASFTLITAAHHPRCLWSGLGSLPGPLISADPGASSGEVTSPNQGPGRGGKAGPASHTREGVGRRPQPVGWVVWAPSHQAHKVALPASGDPDSRGGGAQNPKRGLFPE